MTRTSIRLSLLAAAACLTLGVAQAQGSSTGNTGASPGAPGTQVQDQDTSAKDVAPGSTVRNPASDTKTAPKAKKKAAAKKADKTEGAEPTGDTTQPVK